MTELKPCPFCGGEASIIKYMDGTYCVECENDNCNMIAMTVLADTEARAVEIWNTRPNPWHTEIPSEEGWYIIKLAVSDAYFTNYWEAEGKWRIDMDYNFYAWQKIEPYKEKEDGNNGRT